MRVLLLSFQENTVKKFGHDEGEYIRYGEFQSYFGSNARWARPTVQHHYYDPIDLFDGHVYAKGSLILNMLQDHLGDDAFKRSIQHYTKENKHKNVETPDLKRAIERLLDKILTGSLDSGFMRLDFLSTRSNGHTISVIGP